MPFALDCWRVSNHLRFGRQYYVNHKTDIAPFLSENDLNMEIYGYMDIYIIG